MKWKKKIKPTPTVGDFRTVHRFLFLPLRLGDEVRWMEAAQIEQEFVRRPHDILPHPFYYVSWKDRRWA